MAQKDSMLDNFMKGLGRKLGTRRREVHQAIQRFNEELNKDESPAPAPTTPVPTTPAPTAPVAADSEAKPTAADPDKADNAKADV